ncbi:MAG: tetraacyldisaccharide 4'-kinase [Patiriisocius sp.]|jgi:tetraacyldisaccharide 4'-kinase
MKRLRKLLFPFAIVYGCIVTARNFLYDKQWFGFKSTSYRKPVICVGNLSVGGTGKSPMIELLITLLKDSFELAVLSRGYKRKTSGYLEVEVSQLASQTGDEPLQFKQKFPEVAVAVCEDRRSGIETLLPKADVILLDDAFQHRKVRAGFNILLTPFDDLFYEDYFLPAGNLRESRNGAQRADVIVITKCPDKVPYARLQEIQYLLQLLPHQKVYFSKIGYADTITGINETLPLGYLKGKQFTLVTGIANPNPLVSFLKEQGFSFSHKKYGDHHHFSEGEISTLQKEELILTTEKDYMRLHVPLGKYAIYYLPIKTIILNKQETFFKDTIVGAIKSLKGSLD